MKCFSPMLRLVPILAVVAGGASAEKGTAFVSDQSGVLVAVSFRDDIQAIRPQTIGSIGTTHGDENRIDAIRVRPGTTTIYGFGCNKVHIFDYATAKPLHERIVPGVEELYGESLEFSPNGEYILIDALLEGVPGWTNLVLRADTFEIVVALKGVSFALTFSSDSKSVLYCKAGALWSRDILTGVDRQVCSLDNTVPHPHEVWSCPSDIVIFGQQDELAPFTVFSVVNGHTEVLGELPAGSRENRLFRNHGADCTKFYSYDMTGGKVYTLERGRASAESYRVPPLLELLDSSHVVWQDDNVVVDGCRRSIESLVFSKAYISPDAQYAVFVDTSAYVAHIVLRSNTTGKWSQVFPVGEYGATNVCFGR